MNLSIRSLACVTIACLAGISIENSSAVIITSTLSGGVFSSGTTWVSGTAPSTTSDAFSVVSGATVNVTSTFTSQEATAGSSSISGGTLAIESGGSLTFGVTTTVPQSMMTSGAARIDVESGGSLNNISYLINSGTTTTNVSGSLTTRDYDVSSASTISYTGANAASYIFNVNAGGVMNYRSRNIATSAANNQSFILNLNGGTFIYGASNTRTKSLAPTGGYTIFNISSGNFNYAGKTVRFANTGSNSFNWTGGTLSNVYGMAPSASAETGMNSVILAKFGDSSAKTIDINDANSTGGLTSAQIWNISTATLSGTAGVLQFDMYSPTSADAITTLTSTGSPSTGTLNLSSGISINIGFFGTISDPSSYIGQSFTLFQDFSDYSALNATVQAALWTSGTSQYNVTFTNNLNVDGSVSIASMTAVPEPSTYALVALGITALVAFRTRRQSV